MTSEDRDNVTVDDSDEQVSRPTKKTKKPKKHLPLWQETILLLAIALGLAIVIKALFVQAFYIPSESMEPGLVNNDRILVEKVSYWFSGTPQRGDVVVFKDPGDWLTAEEDAGPPNEVTNLMAKVGLYPSGGHLVKRVIGVAGDTIHCCDTKGRILVNGTPLNEKSYAKLDGAACYGPMTSTCNWTDGPVPAGHIFVMGDNRFHSADSTVHMCRPEQTECVPGDEFVPVSDVVGKVFVLLWPRSHFGWIHRPSDFADVASGS
ncbi:MAG: signal peptidase I [Nocardioides sp.]